MMSEIQIPPPLPSPGVGLRRKGPKSLPRLPLSAFSPPNSGASERFPLPPSPSTVQPDSVIDGHVLLVSGDLNKWKGEIGSALGDRLGGVVLALRQEDQDVEKILTELSNPIVPIVSVVVPFSLQDPPPSTSPSYLSSSKIPISLSTVYTYHTTAGDTSLKWALKHGKPVDIIVEAEMTRENTNAVWESFEDLLTKGAEGVTTPIILSNILPPPHDLTLPIVKLMNHPTYRAYQSQTAALSLFPNIYIKFIPPIWDEPTPASAGLPPAVSDALLSPIDRDSKQKKEWKRRIKMYLGPVLEAFGYQRIIFGSSPLPSSKAESNASDWYEIARESLAELNVDQEAIDAVFSENAKRVYGSLS